MSGNSALGTKLAEFLGDAGNSHTKDVGGKNGEGEAPAMPPSKILRTLPVRTPPAAGPARIRRLVPANMLPQGSSPSSSTPPANDDPAAPDAPGDNIADGTGSRPETSPHPGNGTLIGPDESAALAWPSLVPLDDPYLPTLDLSHLPAQAGDFARALAKATETPPELAAGLVLGVCSAACARRVKVEIKPGYREPTNLWICTVLPSGSRKSGVLDKAAGPLLAWEGAKAAAMEDIIKILKYRRECQDEKLNSLKHEAAKAKDPAEREAIEKEAAEIVVDLIEVPSSPRLWTSDSTPEQLGTLLEDNGECMAWMSSEGGIFELIGGRYSRGVPNLDLILKAHSGDFERVDRGSRPPVLLKRPKVTVVLSPQPSVIEGLASWPEFRGRGLLARFLYLLPPSNLGYRTGKTVPTPSDVSDEYTALIYAMLGWGLDVDDNGDKFLHVLKLTERASDIWREFAQNIEIEMRPGNKFEHAKDWAGKAPGAAARIAAVLHCITYAHDEPWEHPIERETMEAALELMGVFMEHSLAALASMGTNAGIENAKKVWEWIKRRRMPSFGLREAFNALRGTFPRVAQLDAVMKTLQERGYVTITTPEKNGPGRKKSPVISVRPELCGGWK